MWETVPQNEVVLIHSSLRRLWKEYALSPKDVFEALLDRIGPRGTLLLPTFTYEGWCHGQPFDVRNTPSRMGMLTEMARRHPDAIRTGNPMYSVVAFGYEAKRFEHLDNYSGYGADSPFGILLDMEGWIGCIDLSEGRSITFYHFVEQANRVYYRYPKIFRGEWTGWDGKLVINKGYELFVRDLNMGWETSMDRMGEKLWRDGLYKGNRPGEGDGLRMIHSKTLYNALTDVIQHGEELAYLGEIRQ